MDRWLSDEVLEAVQRLKPIAERPADDGRARARLGAARANVASAIIGASRPEQVHENAAAGDRALTDVLEAIDEALGDVLVTGPSSRRSSKEGVKHR